MPTSTEFSEPGMTSKTYETATFVLALLVSVSVGATVWFLSENIAGSLFAMFSVCLFCFYLHQVAKLVVYGIRETKNFNP